MRISINNRVSFGLFKKTQPTVGDLRAVKKPSGLRLPPRFPKDLIYLTLKYKD